MKKLLILLSVIMLLSGHVSPDIEEFDSDALCECDGLDLNCNNPCHLIYKY